MNWEIREIWLDETNSRKRDQKKGRLAKLGLLRSKVLRAPTWVARRRSLLLLLNLCPNTSRFLTNLLSHTNSNLSHVALETVELDSVVNHQVHIRFPSIDGFILVRVELAADGPQVPSVFLGNDVVIGRNLQRDRINGLPEHIPSESGESSSASVQRIHYRARLTPDHS